MGYGRRIVEFEYRECKEGDVCSIRKRVLKLKLYLGKDVCWDRGIKEVEVIKSS